MYVGDIKAKPTINVPTMLSGQSTGGSCVASDNKYLQIPPYFHMRVKLDGNGSEGDCKIKHIRTLQKLGQVHYRQNFSITCNNDSNSVGVKCFTCLNDDITHINVQGV